MVGKERGAGAGLGHDQRVKSTMRRLETQQLYTILDFGRCMVKDGSDNTWDEFEGTKEQSHQSKPKEYKDLRIGT